jgi:23S rRNA (uracil1939-C5)-methyltransferase
VHIEHRSPHLPRAWGRRVALELPSPDRQEPRCPRFGICGGCTLQHLSAAGQLEAKRARVQRALAAHPGPGGAPWPEVAPVLGSPSDHGYRAFAKYVVARGAGGGFLASYRPRTHEPVDMSPCTVIEPAVAEVAAAHASYLAGTDALPLRYLLLRAAHDGRVLAVWVVREDPGPRAATEAALMLARQPALAGVVLHVNPSDGDGLLAGPSALRSLAGVDHLEERVGALRLRLSAGSFFQINRVQAGRLYGLAARLASASPGETVVDLYAGIGGLALSVAGAAEGTRVLGVELSAAAVQDATAGAAASGLSARFACGDAARVSAIFPDLARADVVLLNPPRKGCTPEALAAAAALRASRLVYVSCSPETLARDLVRLAGHGYLAEEIHPVDLFPQTAHMETVVLLHRQSG